MFASNHRWTFDASTGARLGGDQCLVRCPVRETDGDVQVDVSALVSGRTADRRRLRSIGELPGPRRLPLVGSALQIGAKRMHLDLEKWAADFGVHYQLQLGRQRGVVLSDPRLIEQALRARPNTFRRLRRIERIFDELHASGVFAAEEPAWRPQRRLAMRALSHHHLKGFYDTLHTVAERLVDCLSAAADRGDEIDVERDLKRFTVDVTTWLAFGHDSNTLSQPDDVLQRYLGEFLSAIGRRLGAAIPYWRLVRLPRDRRADRTVAAIHDFVIPLIAQCRATMEREPERAAHPRNFLEAMLVARDESGQPFSDEMILGNAITMLMAGEDTTANTLCWVVHELCDAPDAVAALRDEIDRALGDTRLPATIETANRLTYSNAIANETMRLRPAASFIVLEAIEDTSLGDFDIPGGTAVYLLTRPPVLDPQHFADPTTFRPERWLGETSPGEAHVPATHLPFGSGPRICPGRSLALLEMRIVLAALYRNFEVERVGDRDEVVEEFAFVTRPRGLRVRLRHRRSDRTASQSRVATSQPPAAAS